MAFITNCRIAIASAILIGLVTGCQPATDQELTEDVDDTATSAAAESEEQMLAQADSGFAAELEELSRATLPVGGRPFECGQGSGEDTGWVTVGPGGDTLRLSNGHVLNIPAGAVSSDRRFRLHEPPTPHVQVIASVNPAEAFAQPTVTVTVSYSRCTGGERADSLWRIRQGTLTNVTGTNSGTAITSIPLDRLSNYALAVD